MFKDWQKKIGNSNLSDDDKKLVQNLKKKLVKTSGGISGTKDKYIENGKVHFKEIFERLKLNKKEQEKFLTYVWNTRRSYYEKEKREPAAAENTVTIPAKITHKYDLKKPETFSDLDRLTVHMHNNIAMLVEVVKEIAATEKARLVIDQTRLVVRESQLAVQKEQLKIQEAMYQRAMEKK